MTDAALLLCRWPLVILGHKRLFRLAHRMADASPKSACLVCRRRLLLVVNANHVAQRHFVVRRGWIRSVPA
jgi:hypothetical protein